MVNYSTRFRNRLENLAKNNISEGVTHSGTFESAIALGLLFKYAESQVRMYVGNFCGEISDDKFYLENLSSYLESGKRLDVIIRDIKTNPSEAYKKISLYESLSDNVTIKHISEDIFTGGNDVHFAIADINKYRVEFDTINYVGVINFNDAEQANFLINIFDEVFEKIEAT